MTYTNNGTVYCPCCTARIDITIAEEGRIYVAVHGIVANKFEKEEEEEGAQSQREAQATFDRRGLRIKT